MPAISSTRDMEIPCRCSMASGCSVGSSSLPWSRPDRLVWTWSQRQRRGVVDRQLAGEPAEVRRLCLAALGLPEIDHAPEVLGIHPSRTLRAVEARHFLAADPGSSGGESDRRGNLTATPRSKGERRRELAPDDGAPSERVATELPGGRLRTPAASRSMVPAASGRRAPQPREVVLFDPHQEDQDHEPRWAQGASGGLKVSGLGRLTGDARIVYCRAKFAMLMTLLLALTVMRKSGCQGQSGPRSIRRDRSEGFPSRSMVCWPCIPAPPSFAAACHRNASDDEFSSRPAGTPRPRLVCARGRRIEGPRVRPHVALGCSSGQRSPWMCRHN